MAQMALDVYWRKESGPATGSYPWATQALTWGG